MKIESSRQTFNGRTDRRTDIGTHRAPIVAKKDVDNVNNQVNFGSDMLALDGMSFLSGLTKVVLDELEISVKEYEGVNEVFCQKLNSQAS